jgi:hypothetical protein
MSEANKHKPGFADRLPKHSPGKDLWPGIEKGLAGVGSASLSDRLPKRKPQKNLWPAISRKLPVAWYSLRSVYMRSILAALIIMILWIVWYDAEKVGDGPEKNQSEIFSVQTTPEKESELMLKQNTVIPEPEIHNSENYHQINNEEQVSLYQDIMVTEAMQPETESEIKTGENVTGSDFPIDNESLVVEPAAIIYAPKKMDKETPPELLVADPLQTLSSLTCFDHATAFSEKTHAPQLQASSGRKLFVPKEVDFEVGMFIQPSMIRSISTIHDDWVFSPGAGVSIGMVQNRFLLETGVSLSRVEFEDKIEVDYFAFVFLGTVITPTQQIEEYVNEQGDTLTQVTYSVDVIDVYDSVFVADEKNDVVKLSTTTIPLTAGYRIYDEGRKYLDLKTGLDMMIITGRVIPGNPVQENIKVTDVRNSLASKYSLKWKYHISLGAGLRMSERMSLYAEPTLWWYPDGIRDGETMGIKHPFEAGMKVGLKWTF